MNINRNLGNLCSRKNRNQIINLKNYFTDGVENLGNSTYF